MDHFVCLQVIQFHGTSDWVNGLAYGDVDHDGEGKVILGTRDGYIEALRVDRSQLTSAGSNI